MPLGLRSSFFALMVLIATACFSNGPYGMVPGGRLEGATAEPPETWGFLGDGTQCELEVNPLSPTSVYIDCYTHQGQLYVHSHRWARMPRLWGEAWVTAAERSSEVRLRAEGRIYELRAEIVTDDSLRQRVLLARGFDPVPEGIQLFALSGRATP